MNQQDVKWTQNAWFSQDMYFVHKPKYMYFNVFYFHCVSECVTFFTLTHLYYTVSQKTSTFYFKITLSKN